MTDQALPNDLLDLMSDLGPEDHLRLTPPDEIWSGIEATLADEPVSLMDRRRRRQAPAILLAAAAVLAVVAISTVWLRSGDEGSVVAATAITSEGLQLEGPDGTARLVEVDGQFELELDVSALPDVDGFYEVWIIDTDVAGMFSLGVVDTDSDGRFLLPNGVDPGDFPVVDISSEPLDGDPTHSGQSILRGVLDV